MRDLPPGPLGPSSNGHPANGRSPNGHAVNGHAVNGHGTNGYATNGHATNGHATNGQARNGHARNGRPVNGTHVDAGRVNGVVRHLPFRSLALDDDAEGTPDLVAVQADDELINALGAGPTASPAHRRPLPVDVSPRWPDGPDAGDRGRDDRIVEMLAAWRAEIDADPIPELIDVDTAVAAVVAAAAAHDAAARRRRVGRARHLAPLTAAAAIVVATLTGVTLGSQDAVPGDTLWAIQKVVNPERAESVEAKVEVETRLAKMRTALRNGDTATAARELEAIRTQIPAVRAEEGLPQLVQEEEFLAAKLADTPPGKPADLSTPPRSNPRARSTSSPAAPAGVPSVDPVPSGPGPADPAAPDVASVPADPRSEAAVPVPPGGGSPAEPGPDVSDSPPPVTSVPDETRPEPPAPPAPGPGNSEGGTDPTVAPAPVDPPPSSADSPPPGDTPTASDTTTASGSAGSSVETTPTT